MKDLFFRSLPQLAVAEGASTPNPGSGRAFIWSTTASKPLVWNGSLWGALGSSGGTAVTYSETPPVDTSVLWVDTNDLSLNVFYNDGSSSQWVALSGPAGLQGPAGVGVPTGGTAGQVLAKNSATDYDTVWVNAGGGGGGIATPSTTLLNGIATFGDSLGDSLLSPQISASTDSISGTNTALAVTNLVDYSTSLLSNGTLPALTVGPNTGGSYRTSYSNFSRSKLSNTNLAESYKVDKTQAISSPGLEASSSMDHTSSFVNTSLSRSSSSYLRNTQLATGTNSTSSFFVRTEYKLNNTESNHVSGISVNASSSDGIASSELSVFANNDSGTNPRAGVVLKADLNRNSILLKTHELTTSPETPPAEYLSLFSRSQAGRILPAFVGPAGIDSNLQPALFRNSVYMWLPGTGTTLSINWGTSWTARNSGTGAAQDHPTKASTSAMTSLNRARFSTGTTATGSSGIQSSASVAWRGNAAGLGGFFFFSRFGIETFKTGIQGFVGLSSRNAAMTASPYTTNNSIGIGFNETDTNMFLFSVGNTGTLEQIELADLPVNSGRILDFMMFAPPNSSFVTFRVVDAVTGQVYAQEDTISNASALPAANTFLFAHASIRSTTGTTAALMALNRIYVETDL